MISSNDNRIKPMDDQSLEIERRPLEDGFHHQVPEDQAPEALVRMETRVIDILRCLLIGILIIVATATSIATFKQSRKWEVNTFHDDFEGIATRMAQIFLEQTSAKLWFAYTMSVAITDLSGSSFPNTSVTVLYNLAQGVNTIAKSNHAVWAPLLHNVTEREAFEAYARKATGQLDPTATLCYVCGSKDLMIGKPHQIVQLPTVAPYTCSDIEIGGLGGLIPPKTCSLVQSYAKELCGCITNNKTRVEKIASKVFSLNDGIPSPVDRGGPTFPVWQVFPSSDASNLIMFDQLSDPVRGRALQSMMKSGLPTFSGTGFPTGDYYKRVKVEDTPMSTLFQPVFQSPESSTIVGTLALDFSWAQHFSLAIPLKSDGAVVVFENKQGQAYSFTISGDALEFVGHGDIHDPAFDSLYHETTFDQFKQLITALWGEGGNYEDWLYKVRIYPSNEYKSRYLTSKPVIYTTVVVLIFVFTSAVFIIYDCLVRRRQQKVMNSAMRNNAIVSSLFPASIRNRLLTNNNQELQSDDSMDAVNRSAQKKEKTRKLLLRSSPRAQLTRLLRQSLTLSDDHVENDTDPIADFFPRCTIIFADITGFTAWSSEREPSQVFRLLETVYRAFDQLAKKHGVFKIETIGDCYVAATGLPDAQEDHAIRITNFAHECRFKMSELTKSLEASLGPGTGDLCIRIGIHSGPVTGGVLRGEKARFQLFGDTMNTAARMESTGNANLIQASPATAELLVQSGLSHWLQPREGGVFVKGKGDMQTFWVNPAQLCDALKPELAITALNTTTSLDSSYWGSPSFDSALTCLGDKSSDIEKLERLVDWNTVLLQRLLQRIVARKISKNRSASIVMNRSKAQQSQGLIDQDISLSKKKLANPIEEMTEVLTMPHFCGKTEQRLHDPEKVALDVRVVAQLREYVRCVALMYQNNPFHNFEHASHVAMSAWKIMNRIIKPEGANYHNSPDIRSHRSLRKRVKDLAEEIHQSTFGISSDPLMQFAVVFCAIIHDADHPGVTNAQLVHERSNVAVTYKNKCVAEQNSVQICWELLMDDRFVELRSCICANDDECQRFRQLVVNAVIATDIADKELQLSRKRRWDKAFEKRDDGSVIHPCTEQDINRKATVVFEYIIQASDVAHTMQHWHIYSRWNERLFEERCHAFLAGRETVDPSIGWYNGELWFFDNYIIPLANELEHCGVFGVSSDEYLNYALENRREWEVKGQDIVNRMAKKYRNQPVRGATGIPDLRTCKITE